MNKYQQVQFPSWLKDWLSKMLPYLGFCLVLRISGWDNGYVWGVCWRRFLLFMGHLLWFTCRRCYVRRRTSLPIFGILIFLSCRLCALLGRFAQWSLHVPGWPNTIPSHARKNCDYWYQRQWEHRQPLDNNYLPPSKYFIVTALNCSWPAVSQICVLAFLPSSSLRVLEVNSVPMVGFTLNGFLPLSKVNTKFVFPTPASPITMTTSFLSHYFCRRFLSHSQRSYLKYYYTPIFYHFTWANNKLLILSARERNLYFFWVLMWMGKIYFWPMEVVYK